MALKIIRDDTKPFLIRAEFSKVLTILCFLQAQVWTILAIYFCIKYSLDSTFAIALLGFVFLGENVAIVGYFSKAKLYNATKLKTDSIKEIYTITKDRDKALEELDILEDVLDNEFTELANENLEESVKERLL